MIVAATYPLTCHCGPAFRPHGGTLAYTKEPS